MYRKCLKIFDLIYLSLDVLNREWIASAVIGMLQRKVSYGREPWSSGYGKRLTIQRSWVRIPAP